LRKTRVKGQGSRIQEMTKKTSFKRLIAWQKTYELTPNIYTITKKFPKSNGLVLKTQSQKAAISIPANIAEGYERQHGKEYLQVLSIDRGSLGELETYTLLAKDLSYITEKEYEQLNNLRSEVGRPLRGLVKSLS